MLQWIIHGSITIISNQIGRQMSALQSVKIVRKQMTKRARIGGKRNDFHILGWAWYNTNRLY